MGIHTLLIANRGEIACRIIRTARAMGIFTVAVYSDADKSALHVRMAQEAVHLPGTAAADTYLRVDRLIDAARQTGADAVHPGYGFLSEHADFARECADAGITFVGPSAEAIAVMGNKVEAKARMAEAGVPVLPGVTLSADTSFDALAEAGERVGYPLLVKAAFGGGGRGMRIVSLAGELAGAVESARREAAAAFGDGLVFLERYVTNPRHIEVQVFADTHGNAVHLFERECSIQRRHQKVIEEAPSPAVDEALRTRLGDAAVAAARSIGYVGAGTVEFVMTPEREFFFLEMNTRLQVEHPVTELITGLDLVQLQLQIADGEPLPDDVLTPTRRGHAIEARLYAEDVPAGFLPTSGRLVAFDIPHGSQGSHGATDGAADERGDGSIVRVDAGYERGDTVSTYYDAMLAKVIAWAPDRQGAAFALSAALRRARLYGPETNRELLVHTLLHTDFLRGDTDTAFYERHEPAALGTSRTTVEVHRLHALAVAVTAAHGARTRLDVPYGFRNVGAGWHTYGYTGDLECAVAVRQLRSGGWEARFESDDHVFDIEVRSIVERGDTGEVEADLVVDNRSHQVTIQFEPDETWATSGLDTSHLVTVPRFPPPASSDAAGSLHSPLPGTVVRVDVALGDTVRRGDVLVVLEAMKMEHAIRAPHDGVVRELDVAVGSQVETGATLVVVTDEGSD